jgi:hypothetical protein
VKLRSYRFAKYLSDAAPRQMPSFIGDKNLGKENGEALKVVN